MARGVYGTPVNTGKGVILTDATPSMASSLNGEVGPVAKTEPKVVQPNYTSNIYTAGTKNYYRNGAFITVANPVTDVNGVAVNDFDLTKNGTLASEQHSSKYGRKLVITEIDQNGNVTYGATNGVTYGLYHTSGTPVDRDADAAKDPYGTPPRFVSLKDAAPAVFSYSSLTSY